MKNNKKRKLAFIGGDARQFIAASRLRSLGYETSLFGFGDSGESSVPAAVDSLCCSSCFAKPHEIITDLSTDHELDCGVIAPGLDEALADTDAVVLPLPASGDGVRISMPLSISAEVTLTDLIPLMKNFGVTLLCAGKLPVGFAKLCESRGITVFDYYECEEFAIANAVPTAEGAVEIAMHELPITLSGSSALVIGYGRIGKALSRLLHAMGVNVTVSARKPHDLAWISAAGYKAVSTECLCSVLETRFDMVFNTVPHKVLDKAALEMIPRGCLIVDLASKPGGVDIAEAERMKHRVIWALSLPGKVAPVTSGEIIANTVKNGIDRIIGGG